MTAIRRDLGMALGKAQSFGDDFPDTAPDPRTDMIARLMQEMGVLSQMQTDLPPDLSGKPMSESGYTELDMYGGVDQLERVGREGRAERELEDRKPTDEEFLKMIRDSMI